MRFIVLLSFLLIAAFSVSAQNRTELVCGDIVESNFTDSDQTLFFTIDMRPGEVLEISASRFGDYLLFRDQCSSSGDGYSNYIYAPSGDVVAGVPEFDNSICGETIENIRMRTGLLGEQGRYTVTVHNETATGAFNLSVGCVDSSGNRIEPGETIVPTPVVPNPQPGGLVPQVTFGYPGVAAIDFSGTSRTEIIPQLFGVPITSSIPVNGSGISGFSLEAAEGDILEIDARRSQGNLGIGFVVFAEPNIPVFIAGPVVASTFSTQIELPQDGSYVIGLFRMGDVPANAQATAFQITVNLNP